MPKNSTTNSSNFPPNTHEVQLDEKWDFVRKKQKNCDENNPADARCGDNWDYVALDPENKLVLKVVNGKRTEENTELLVQNTAKRLQFKPPRLITSDEYRPYKKAILKAFGEKCFPRRTGKRGRPQGPRYCPKPELVYATVHKTRTKGRVTKIDYRTVFGTEAQVQAALEESPMQSQGKHVVYRASKRNRPKSLQPQSSEVVLFFKGLGCPSRSDVFEHVQLQFLLAGSDLASARRSPRAMQSGDVRWTCQPCLDTPRMVGHSRL